MFSCAQRYFSPLAPGAEASLEYKFRADPILGGTPAREFIVALHLLYEVRTEGVLSPGQGGGATLGPTAADGGRGVAWCGKAGCAKGRLACEQLTCGAACAKETGGLNPLAGSELRDGGF